MSLTLAQMHRAHIERRARLWPTAGPAPADEASVVRPEASVEPAPVSACEATPPMAEPQSHRSVVEVVHTCEEAGDRIIFKAEIIRAVADHYGVSVIDLQSVRRTVKVVRPRQIAMWLCRSLTAHSLPSIGRSFGGRDHTTAIHACRKIDALMAEDDALRAEVEVLREKILKGRAG